MSEHDPTAPIPQRPTDRPGPDAPGAASPQHPADDPMAYPAGAAATQHPAGPDMPGSATPQPPSGPYLPGMIAGLVLIITGGLVATYRLVDVDSGVPSIPWVIVVLGVVLIVAGVLGTLTNRRRH